MCLHFVCTPRCHSDESIQSPTDQPFYSQPLILQLHQNPVADRSWNTPQLLDISVCFLWFDPIQISECDYHKETVVRKTISPKFYTEHRALSSSVPWCWIWICLFWRICPYMFPHRPIALVLNFLLIWLSFRMHNRLCCCSLENSMYHPADLLTVWHWCLCWKCQINQNIVV